MILPFILHHANRTLKSPEFYAIKDRLLTNCETIGYDVQHIEGKICHSCNGSGQHHKYDRYGFVYDTDLCWFCVRGWHKQEAWVLLARKKFGRYVFHKPIQREYRKVNPFKKEDGWNTGENLIEGYVDHRSSRYGYLAVLALFLIYDRKAFKKYFYEMGVGWRIYWWYPMNWLYVVAHFVRYGRNAYPLKDMRDWFNKKKYQHEQGVQYRQQIIDDDLPF